MIDEVQVVLRDHVRRWTLFIETLPTLPIVCIGTVLVYCICHVCQSYTLTKRNTEVLDIEMSIPIKTNTDFKE